MPKRPKPDPDDIHAVAAAELKHLLEEMQGVKPTFKQPLPKSATAKPQPNNKPPRKVEGTPRESPVMKYVRSLAGGPYLTAIEVANEVGVSVQAVRKYAKSPDLKAPSKYAPFGRLKIYLYTQEDVQEIKDYLEDRQQVQSNEKGEDPS